jgi:hypothetical protein
MNAGIMGPMLSHMTDKLPFITKVYLIHSLIRVNRLLESVSLCPKVILLCGFHCGMYGVFSKILIN